MPIFLALAVLYKYIAIITANVLYPQPEHFANAQTGGIDSMEYGPVLNVFSGGSTKAALLPRSTH